MSFKTDYVEKKEMATELESIVGLIQSNQISAWEWELGNTTDAVALENHKGAEDEPTLIYNGWFDKLNNLIAILKENN